MKTLITLSVLQTIGIAALVVHVFREEQLAADSRPVAAPTAVIASGTAPTVDEAWLRRIIREELARQHNRPASEHNASAAQPTPPRAATAADLQRRDNISQRIEAYAATGAITDAQMSELQADIARLDPANRRQMMSKLVRSMNSGDIKGRL
jgi:hypothetical protein